MKPLTQSFLPFALLALASSTANASLTFYDNQATFNSLVTTTLVDDYETGGPRETALSSLTRNGVTYTPLAGVPYYNVYLANAGYNNFGAGVGITTTSILTANGDEHFTASFASSVGAVSFDTYRNGLGPTTVSVYSNATLLGTFTPAGNPDDKGFMGFISSGPAITSFEWNSTLGGRVNTGIDNLRSAPMAAPVPAAAWLLGSGLIGLAGVARKRKAA